MLRGAREMCGWPIVAEDDEVGRLSDVYFDDWWWTVRYFVVHTSHWPVGRSVLISPRSVDGVDPARQVLRTSLSRSQVALSPDLDRARPVSRQHELELSHYYAPVCPYEPGTWGPAEAERIIVRHGGWRSPKSGKERRPR